MKPISNRWRIYRQGQMWTRRYRQVVSDAIAQVDHEVRAKYVTLTKSKQEDKSK